MRAGARAVVRAGVAAGRAVARAVVRAGVAAVRAAARAVVRADAFGVGGRPCRRFNILVMSVIVGSPRGAGEAIASQRGVLWLGLW